ncbi:MAG: hypothetical protein ACRD4X_18200 [Candidatus Acidiferrales bacterium]
MAHDEICRSSARTDTSRGGEPIKIGGLDRPRDYIQLAAHSPLFDNSFPVIFGVLVWAGLFLRDAELRAMIPWRAKGAQV